VPRPRRNSLFELEQQFERDGASAEFCVEDAGDSERVRRLLREHRVDIIFHAAAYKHVPLMEKNHAGAVKNNVVALRLLPQVAEEVEVQGFLLISSDKAVNPKSVMGCPSALASFFYRRGLGGCEP
jgi:FlaA1/EpsC-like NDP-sugar epimerase